jgi:hypothetical protein
MRGEVRAGRREAVGRRRRKRHAQGRPGKTLEGQGTRAAHVEHLAHVSHLGRVKAERLVERERVLPSRKGCVRCGARCMRASRRGCMGRRRRKRHARGRPHSRLGGQGTRGAHVEHAPHVRDLGRVKVEWLVERRRVLPSRKEGVRCGGEVRAGRPWGGGGASGMHGEGPTQGLGVRARAERTRNMPLMSVTVEVSKLSGWLNAFAFCRVERGGAYEGGARFAPGGGRPWGGGGASGMHGEDPTQG